MSVSLLLLRPFGNSRDRKALTQLGERGERITEPQLKVVLYQTFIYRVPEKQKQGHQGLEGQNNKQNSPTDQIIKS